MSLEDKGGDTIRRWERLRSSWATAKFYSMLTEPEREDSQKFSWFYLDLRKSVFDRGFRNTESKENSFINVKRK